MHTQAKCQTKLMATAVFSIVFLLLFSLVPSMKASAATKSFTVECTGGTISYYNSSVTTISTNTNVTVTCTNKGSFTITVKPHTGTSSRTISLTAQNGTKTIDTLNITQKAVPQTSISATCTGGNFSFTKSGAYSYIYSNSAVCNGRSGNYFVVEPNTSTSSRSCKVTVKNKVGNVIHYVNISQSGVPTKSYSGIAYTGSSIVFSPGCSASYSFDSYTPSTCTGWCSRNYSNNTIVVKSNILTQKRSCRCVVRNSAGKTIYYLYITQNPVPVKNVTVTGGYTSFAYGKSGATSLTASNKNMIYNITASNPGNYTVFVSANPSSASARSTDIIVKNSSNVYLEVIHVVQNAYITPSTSVSCNSDPRTITYTCFNADPTKTVVSNPAMCTCTSLGNSKYQLIIAQNEDSKERSCTVTFKDKYGTVVMKYNIKQTGVTIKNISVVGGASTYSYYNSSAVVVASKDKKMIYNVTSPSKGNFTLSISANPSTTANRTTQVIVKKSGGAYLEVLNFSQSKFVVPNTTESYNSDPRTVTFTCPYAVLSKTTYSNPAMFKTGTELSGNKFQFKLSQNPDTTARTNKVTFRDQFGTVIATYTVKQAGVHLTIKDDEDGCPSLLFYSGNSKIASFSYDKANVTSITSLDAHQFSIIITANSSTTAKRTFDIIAKNSSGAYVDIIRITQKPHSHSYTYTSSIKDDCSRVLIRECRYCTVCDKDVSYKEYLKYQGLTDCEKNLTAYMKALGYAESSKETTNIVSTYKYLKKNSNMDTAEKIYRMQGWSDLKDIADTVAIFARNDKLNNSLTIISAINNVYGFLTSSDAAGKFSYAVKLSGDVLGAGLDEFTGGYLSSALGTVGDALKDTIPKVIQRQDQTLYLGLYVEDMVNNFHIANLSINQVKSDAFLRSLIDNKVNETVEKVYSWKVAYEEQKALNQIYTALGKKVTVYTDDFWGFVCYWVQ